MNAEYITLRSRRPLRLVISDQKILPQGAEGRREEGETIVICPLREMHLSRPQDPSGVSMEIGFR